MKRFSVALIVLFMMACGGGPDIEAMKNEVLDIHDEVMPRMGEVMKLRRQVLSKAETLSGESTPDQSAIDALNSLAEKLNSANDGMMIWMREWTSESSGYLEGDQDKAAAAAYLESEKKKVEKVKTDILEAIKEAEELLGSD